MAFSFAAPFSAPLSFCSNRHHASPTCVTSSLFAIFTQFLYIFCVCRAILFALLKKEATRIPSRATWQEEEEKA